MKKVFTILAILIFSKMSYAQNMQQASDTAAIKQTINTLFDAKRKGDSTLYDRFSQKVWYKKYFE